MHRFSTSHSRRVSSVALALIAACGDDGDPRPFTIGPTHTVSVDVPAGAPDPTVSDPVTGLVFAFPEGGRGELGVAAITSGPDAPFVGAGYYLEIPDALFTELVVSGADGGQLDRPIVLGFATRVGGIFDDALGAGPRWVALPWRSLASDRLAFELTLPDTPVEALLAPAVAPRAAALTGVQPTRYYWISKLGAATTDLERRQLLSLQLGDHRDAFLALLSPSLRAEAEARVAEAPLTLEHDGNYYKGFWWRSLGSHGRRVHPTVHVTLDGFSLAHEASHHFVHLLVGHDVQSTLEGQAPLFGEHAIRNQVGRESLVENYAYFVEYLLTGKGGSYDLASPHVVFGGLTPSADEIPGVEGFGALLLTALLDSSTAIADAITGETVAVPPVGLDPSAILDLAARGATDMDGLRAHVFEAVGAARAAVRVHRLGWRYTVRVRLVDEDGRAVAGARA